MRKKILPALPLLLLVMQGAAAIQYPTQPTSLSSRTLGFVTSLNMTVIPETERSARGVVYKNSAERWVIEIPVPPWLKQQLSSTPYSATPDKIFPWGDGTAAPCAGAGSAAAKNITFMPIIADYTDSSNTLASSDNILSDFDCTYDPRQTFVRCEDRVYGNYYFSGKYSKYSTLSFRDLEFVAMLGMIPNCASAKQFTTIVRKANDIAAIIGGAVGGFVFLLIVGYAVCLFGEDIMRCWESNKVTPSLQNIAFNNNKNNNNGGTTASISAFRTDLRSFLSSAQGHRYSAVPPCPSSSSSAHDIL